MPELNSTRAELERLRIRFIKGAKFFMFRPDLVGGESYNRWIFEVVEKINDLCLLILEETERPEDVLRIKEVLADFGGRIVKLTERSESQVLPSKS